uniref:Uncharacterized protein n=1 Tax=Setaria viridis TaxID=4556 RepID=A0A4U6TH09_SETVI|nr:hypothetical protein SEVIR_8G071125v2 [Setaria viridis]
MFLVIGVDLFFFNKHINSLLIKGFDPAGKRYIFLFD